MSEEMRKVNFKVEFFYGRKLLVLEQTPTYSMPRGLVVFTDKDINEYSTKETRTDIIAGQKIYEHPDIGTDNFIKQVFMKKMTTRSS